MALRFLITWKRVPIVLLFVIILKSFPVAGQFEKRFSPIAIQDTIPSTIHESLKLRLKKDKESITARGKVGGYIRTLYDQRFDFVVKTFNEDYFMIDDDLALYVQGVLNNIYEANPQLLRETDIYIYRSEVPNATSFGEGTISIMLGLIARAETEDVLAYVLCHELAHYHAEHAPKKIQELAELNYDRVLKKQIDAILSSPYGRYTKMKALLTSLDLSTSRHSREKEFEADSLGLVYFFNTRYNRLAPLRCMEILERADSSTFKNNIDFRKYFNFKEFPFKDSWDTYTKSDVWHAPLKGSDSDTSKTHPDCRKRYEALRNQLKIDNPNPEELKRGKPIKPIADLAAFEIVNSLYHFKHYGKALFHAIVLAEQFPENAYAHAMIIKSLYQLYKSQKNHSLGKVLQLPDPRFEENYDRFLTFVHKLRLFEVASLSYYYAITRPESFFSDEEFLHALWMVSTLEISKLSPEKIRMDYETLYPRGKYVDEMKNY